MDTRYSWLALSVGTVLLAACGARTTLLLDESPDPRLDAGADVRTDSITKDSPIDQDAKPLVDVTSKDVVDVTVVDVISEPVPDTTPVTWDLQAYYTRSDFARDPNELKIFGKVVVNNQVVQASLDGTQDDTYVEYTDPCSGAPRAHAWHVERKFVGANSYRLLVRGISRSDCSLGQPVSAGHLELNPSSEWRIDQTVSCSVMKDNNSNGEVIPTYCVVAQTQGTIDWQAGSECGGCCACDDGAVVNIEVLLARP